MNFYKHHLGDYAAKTAHLSWDEDCAYRRLIDIYYKRETPIPVDLKEASRLARASTPAQRRAVEAVLREFFTLADDGWHQKRCDEEIGQANAQAETNRRIAEEREAKKRARLEHESLHASGNDPSTNRSPAPTESVNLARLQTPDSRLQKRETDPGGSAAEAAPAPAPKPMTAKDRVWALGVPLVGEKGRAALGKLVAEHGVDLVAEVLEQATVDPPVGDPKAWVIASCAARAKAQPGQRRIDAPQPGTAQALIDQEANPSWLAPTGFPNVWEASNAGCHRHTAHLFRDGRRTQ